jgi:parallel beta helix pectate lyase-like protein
MAGGIRTLEKSRKRTLSFGSLAVSVALALLTLVPAIPSWAETCSGVPVRPGQRLQALINDRPPGTTFCLRSGTYVLSRPLHPKADQRFVGVERRRAVLTGRGVQGTFAFDGGGVTGVEVRRLVIRGFYPPRNGGFGSIKAGPGWRIVDNRIGPNRNIGIFHEAHTVIRGNRISGNTLAGIVGWRALGSRVVGNIVAYNGRSMVAGLAGGGKWYDTIGVIVARNRFHHNWNNAIWVDGGSLGALVEDNRVVHNYGRGIHHEISCGGVIRRNVVARNRGVGIFVVASREVRIARNRVAFNGGDIQISHQDRTNENPTEVNCPWVTGRVDVIENRVTMARGGTGVWTWRVADGDKIFHDGRIRFAGNHYRADRGLLRPFMWAGGKHTWRQWRTYGLDVSGTFLRF